MRIHEIINETLSRDMRKWVTGGCYEFALALLERFPDGELVALSVGPVGSDHVGVRVANQYLDARGTLTADEFAAPFGYNKESIVSTTREEVELSCGLAGMEPPYRNSKDMEDARKAVRRLFGTRS